MLPGQILPVVGLVVRKAEKHKIKQGRGAAGPASGSAAQRERAAYRASKQRAPIK
jgi:hypothetical protein